MSEPINFDNDAASGLHPPIARVSAYAPLQHDKPAPDDARARLTLGQVERGLRQTKNTNAPPGGSSAQLGSK
ncbi:unnamed protein product [Boreogadus saida]